MAGSDYDFNEITNIFQEPKGFRPESPKPTATKFYRNPEAVEFGPQDFIVHLPAKHSLWANEMWNAGRSLALYLDNNKELYQNKRVLELGAGAALPSMICAVNGASKVVSTDYPEQPLLDNIWKNAKANISDKVADGVFTVKGYLWGTEEVHMDEPLTVDGKFDVILMADLIFNHSQHRKILQTCKEVLKHNGIVIKTYSHHVVKWASRDMEFFDHAKEFGFEAQEIYEERWDPMFPNDPGDVEVRSIVKGWILKYPKP